MGAPKAEVDPHGFAMLLCTCCGELVVAVITMQDRRGGASVCIDCLAVAWEVLEAHTGMADDSVGGGVTELA